MLNQKQIHILILLLLLFPSSVVYSAWSEPTQAPTGGNAAVPIYSEGSGQTLNGTLHVDPTATNPTSLQGSGSTNGVQGNSVGNGLFGNLTNNGAGGGRAVYGLAVDAADYGLYTGGGLGLGVASGDIWFLQQDQGIAWPRESDGASLYGVYVTNTGELQVRGHGAGINFMDQNAASRLTVSEAGAVNVVAGPLTVGGTAVCLSSGAGCPAPPPPPSSYWSPNGNEIYPTNSGAVTVKHNLWFESYNQAQNVIDFDPDNGHIVDPLYPPQENYLLIKSGRSPTYGEKWHLRINRTGETIIGSDLYLGKGNGIASIDANNPTNNVAWAIRGKSGVPLIEAEPAGDATHRGGDINLKNGALTLKYLNNANGDVTVNDTLDVQYGIKNSTADNGGAVYVPDDLKVTGGGGFGGYNPDLSYKVSTPSLYSYWGTTEQAIVGWDVTGSYKGAGTLNAKQLCMQGDCRSSWAAAAAGGQSLLQVLQTGADASAFAGPTSIGGNVNVGIGQTARLHVKATGNLEALRVVSGLWSPFIVRNSADNADLFRVDQNGNVGIGGVAAPLSNKLTVNGDVVFTGGGVFAFQMEGNAIIQGTVAAPDVVAGTSVTSPLLKIETPQGGNAETRIRSNLSPYWAIYQDDTTDELRFWNNNIVVPNNKNSLTLGAGGNIIVNNALGIGVVPAYPFHVRTSNVIDAVIDGALVVDDQNGGGTGGAICLGANCKTTDWGPNSTAYAPEGQVNPPSATRIYRALPTTNGFDYFCPSGFVVIGIKNTNPASLICGKMW